jgi:hypothetical protein
MKVDILIASYAKDYEWCEYNLRSIVKFCRGFHSVTLLVPSKDVALFQRLEAKYSRQELPVLVKHYVVMPGAEFNHHQAMKCYADVFCPQAEYILHTDSDCLFTAPVCPDDYIVDGRPVLVMDRYSELARKQDGAVWWKEQTERALGYQVEFEFMRRHPAVHHREVYRRLREHVESRHLVPFTDYCLKQKNSALQGVSEFNCLGAIAYSYFRDAYEWVDLETSPQPDSKLWQGWTWHPQGIEPYRDQINRILS